MLHTLLPLLAAATQPAEPAPYPARAVLAAFATACSGAEDTAVNLASAAAAGWEQLPADAQTPVSQLVRAGMAALAAEAAADPGEDAPVPIAGGEFRKQVAGRTLYVAISGVKLGTSTVRGCRLFDFAAPRPLSLAEVHDWAARPPNHMQELPGGTQKIVYNPGLKPGHMSMEIFFVPPGAQPVPGFELSGLSLVASALEL